MQQLNDSRELSQEVRRSSVSPSKNEVVEDSLGGEENFQSLRISPGYVWTHLLLGSGGTSLNTEEYFTSAAGR